jgi:hypothetical protein
MVKAVSRFAGHRSPNIGTVATHLTDKKASWNAPAEHSGDGALAERGSATRSGFAK